MDMLRMVDLPVRIGNFESVHGIYISPSLERELIIRGDWFMKLVDKAVLLRVKSHVKYQDKKVGVDAGTMKRSQSQNRKSMSSRV